MRELYQERRDALIGGLSSLGWRIKPPRATFYVWAAVPPGYNSRELCAWLLEKAGIVTTPGNGFGPNGEGYFRMALTVSKERIEEAVKRIAELHDK